MVGASCYRPVGGSYWADSGILLRAGVVAMKRGKSTPEKPKKPKLPGFPPRRPPNMRLKEWKDLLKRQREKIKEQMKQPRPKAMARPLRQGDIDACLSCNFGPPDEELGPNAKYGFCEACLEGGRAKLYMGLLRKQGL